MKKSLGIAQVYILLHLITHEHTCNSITMLVEVIILILFEAVKQFHSQYVSFFEHDDV